MYLIRIHLDPLKRQTVRALVNPNLIHGAIQKAREVENTRILWRIDSLNGQTYLLILTPDMIQTEVLSSQFGYPDEEALIKKYDPLLERIVNGSKWRFRLCANPTNALNAGKADRGKVVAHTSPKMQMKWLIKKAEENGFEIDPEKTGLVFSKWVQFKKHGVGNTVSLKESIFEGVLTVTDAELFKEALIQGIGRGKAYGMGLLTVVAYHE